MNGKTVLKMLEKMTDKELENIEFMMLTNKMCNDNIVIEEAHYLSTEIEKLDKVNAEEVAYDLCNKKGAEILEKAYENLINSYEDEIREVMNYYDDHLRYYIKLALIEELEKLGYEVPEGI